MQLAISIDQSKSESVRTVDLIGRVRALTNVGLRLELSEKSGILPVHADPVVQRFWDGSLVIVSHLFLLIHLLRPDHHPEPLHPRAGGHDDRHDARTRRVLLELVRAPAAPRAVPKALLHVREDRRRRRARVRVRCAPRGDALGVRGRAGGAADACAGGDGGGALGGGEGEGTLGEVGVG